MKNALGIITAQVGDNSDLSPLLGHRSIGTLPFGGRYRLIDFSLSNMVNSGIGKVGIVGSTKYSSLIDHLGTGKEWLLSRKTNDLNILTGSVNSKLEADYKMNMTDFDLNKNFLLQRFKKLDRVVVSAPNIVTTFDFNDANDVFDKNKADIVLIYQKIRSDHTTGQDVYLELDGKRVIGLHDEDDSEVKNKFVHMMIIGRDTLLKMIDQSEKSEEYDMFTILKNNLDTLKVYAYEHEGYLSMIYSLEDFYRTNMDLLKYDVLKELFRSGSPVYTKTKDNNPTEYGLHADIKDCIVGSGCFIDGEMNHSIAFREVEVGKNSKIKNSILMQKCQVGENVQLEHVIFDKECIVRDNTKLIGTYEEPIVLSKHSEI